MAGTKGYFGLQTTCELTSYFKFEKCDPIGISCHHLGFDYLDFRVAIQLHKFLLEFPLEKPLEFPLESPLDSTAKTVPL